jgi:hypothetical protein
MIGVDHIILYKPERIAQASRCLLAFSGADQSRATIA